MTITDQLSDALAAVYSGAGTSEAAALLDQMEDRGLRVTAEPARVYQHQQAALFADTAGPVRRDDPATSAQAAGMRGRGTLRVRVLRALADVAMTDEEVADWLGEQASKDSCSKRRSELVEAGLVTVLLDEENRPVTHPTRRGGTAQVWRITPAGREAAR